MFFQSMLYAFMKQFMINGVYIKNSIRQTENGLERGFVKHWLIDCILITSPKSLTVIK